MNSIRNVAVLLALTWGVFGAVSAEGYGACQTPNGATGECMLIQKCPELYNKALNPNLQEAEVLFLRQSKCGTLGKHVLVCCTQATVTVRVGNVKVPPEDDCDTPNSKKGRCISIHECDSLLELVKEDLTANDRNYLTKSVCDQRNQKVCCPDPPKGSRGELPLPPNCGKIPLTGRIFGGTATDIDEFPWTALLKYSKANGGEGLHCGATLINDRYVVTAGHCVSKRVLPASWRLSGVRLGEWNIGTQKDCQFDSKGNELCADPHIDLGIEEEICHPLYNIRTQTHDIALLRLQEKVNYSTYVSPICLPISTSSSTSNYEGITMDIAGWGATETSNSSQKKLKALVKGENLERCKAKYRTYTRIELGTTQMCAGGEKGVDTCRGDSGGPLMFAQSINGRESYFQVGVVSFGPTPCGQEGFPGVYTRVDAFVSWIQNTIRK
ncbi:serine protease easter isoform X2 [Zeugodacus cucurbitae]|uniref:serine protease easter isoform X2 n=1 Tax=Zeugodacus cucurbitae TaxID=28588 RepID=UPI0010A74D0E|nr:serine protease easter isoform X2 [Zeugodacus cucurbitae]